MAEHPPGAAAAQHVAAIDAVRAEQHRVNQRHHFASWPEVPHATAQVHTPVHLTPRSRACARVSPRPAPPHQRPTDHRQAGFDRVQRILHHVGDLLSGAAAAQYSCFFLLRRSLKRPHRTERAHYAVDGGSTHDPSRASRDSIGNDFTRTGLRRPPRDQFPASPDSASALSVDCSMAGTASTGHAAT